MVDMRATRFKIIEFVDSLPMLADSLAAAFLKYDKKGG